MLLYLFGDVHPLKTQNLNLTRPGPVLTQSVFRAMLMGFRA